MPLIRFMCKLIYLPRQRGQTVLVDLESVLSLRRISCVSGLTNGLNKERRFLTHTYTHTY